MIKRDLLKEIENGLKIVMDEVDKGILNNDTRKAFQIINNKMKEMVGIDIDTVNTVSFETIKGMINVGFENSADKYIALGMLLKFQGYLCKSQQDISKEIFYYLISISAFNEGFKDDDTYLNNYKSSIIEIIDEIQKYELSMEESKEIFVAYELLGKYDKAEDVLYEMINKAKDKDKEKMKKLGIDFYNRLLNKNEDDLIKGNLPIEEVKESLKDLI
ncbi:MAG: DUF6483 family protein [Clostridium sp.]|nr:DUF6483 family protein [Clostridium sp.]